MKKLVLDKVDRRAARMIRRRFEFNDMLFGEKLNLRLRDVQRLMVGLLTDQRIGKTFGNSVNQTAFIGSVRLIVVMMMSISRRKLRVQSSVNSRVLRQPDLGQQHDGH